MQRYWATILGALLVTGCSGAHKTSVVAPAAAAEVSSSPGPSDATAAADSSAAQVPANASAAQTPADPADADAASPAPGAVESSSGSGHLHLDGDTTLDSDFAVSGCQVGPPGDGLLSGYRMTSKDGEMPIYLLSVALKEYDKDGSYLQANASQEAAVGRAMTSGVMGPLTMMIARDSQEGSTPLAFMQVPSSKLTITVSDGGSKGDAEFSDLEAQVSMEDIDPKTGAPPPHGKRVSGSLTWTCGSVDHIGAGMSSAINGAFKQLIPDH